jgi:hypothetical protein
MDKASIIVMLEMFGGDAQETIKFLTAPDADVRVRARTYGYHDRLEQCLWWTNAN